MSKVLESESGSFRDHSNQVFYLQGEVYRALTAEATQSWNTLVTKKFFQKAQHEGSIVRTECVPPPTESGIDQAPDQSWSTFLRHARIPFISYPYEWPFGMLKDGALLTLELLEQALLEGMILRDATPYNIQWCGSKPVFIDTTSFEAHRETEPWQAYGQFCELFLYPLMLQAYRDFDFHALLRGSLEGISPDKMRCLMSWGNLLRPGVFSHVFLHAHLRHSHRRDQATKQEVRSAGFNRELILANVRRLKRLVGGLQMRRRASVWSVYESSSPYSAADMELKKQLIGKIAQKRTWGMAWDLGANTGTFSKILAEHSASVVSLDSDHLCVEKLYQQEKGHAGSKLLSLVYDIANPSPALGWMLRERKSMLQRGRPDIVLALALLHHLVIGANIPLRQIIEWLAHRSDVVVIEFISKADPMVQTLLKNRADQYSDYTQERFEALLGPHFSTVERHVLSSQTRTLYLLEARASTL